MTLAPGTTLGPYQILSVLGAGGMGEVYAALDPALGRKIAVKILPADVAADPDRRERFEREARAIAALNHPHIVTIHSIDEADGVRFLTMELVEGQTLDAVLPKGGLPLARLLQIAIPMADAVSAAHERGITHRDLKPQNMMIGADGRVKVLDFGLAKLREQAGGPVETAAPVSAATEVRTGDGRILGTVAYMSPEQAEGKAVDHRTDLFSLGVMLYELATGQRPFTGDSQVSVLAAIVRDTPRSVTELRPELPRDLAKIIRKALSKDPVRRYQTAADIRNDLESLNEDISSGEVATSASPPQRAPARNWVPLAAVAATGLVVVAVAVTYFRGAWLTATPGETTGVGATFRQLTFKPGLEIYPSLSPDGKWLVYSSATDGDEDIYLQSVGGQKAINLSADAPGVDREPAFSPDGLRIAFRSDRDGGGLFVMGRTGEGVRRIADAGFTPAWSPDSRYVAYSTSDGWIYPTWFSSGGAMWIADTTTGQKRSLMSAQASQPAWSPDGTRIAFRSRFDREVVGIWTIPSSGGDPVRVTGETEEAWSPAWSPDGWLYYAGSAGGSYNLWRVRVDRASGAVQGPSQSLAAPAPLVGHLSVSADGRRIAYAAINAQSNYQRIAFDSANARVEGEAAVITTGTQEWDRLDVSPDGQQLALALTGPDAAIFVSEPDGGGIRRLTDESVRVTSDLSGAQWTADGTAIWFRAAGSGLSQIWRIGVDGSGLAQVTTGDRAVGEFWASHDRRSLMAHTHDSPNPTDVQIYDVDGRLVQTLPLKVRVDPKPWSPDGTRLVAEVTAGRGGVYIYTFDGGRFEQVAASGHTPVFATNDTVMFSDGNRQKLLSVDLRTKAVREVISLPPPDTAVRPTFSPDGHWLYYQRARRESDIWMATIK